jgi:hypothetical protein
MGNSDSGEVFELPISGRNMPDVLTLQRRLILCEMEQTGLRLQTEFPDPDTHLPSDLTATGDRPSLRSIPHRKEAGHPTEISHQNVSEVSRFGRVAQIARLLDQLLCILRHSTDTEIKLAQLIQLENETRIILEVVMADQECRVDSFCVPMALSVR